MHDVNQEWWQDVDVSEEVFKERLAEMADHQLQELTADIAGTCAKIMAQLHSGNPDADWSRRAHRAQLYFVARRNWVKAEISSRNLQLKTANYARKRRHVAELRALLGTGDVVGCLSKMIDQIDPDLKEKA